MVAAGNGDKYGRGINIDLYPEFPAAFSFPGQITVAASSQSDFMTEWSNNGFQLVSLAAPGTDILSTITNNQTAYFDGTSMATPFVSGAAALLWSAKPNATAAQIKAALLQSVDVSAGHEFKVLSRGRLNVLKALEKLRTMVP
jgi:subtilisin family serine protease